MQPDSFYEKLRVAVESNKRPSEEDAALLIDDTRELGLIEKCPDHGDHDVSTLRGRMIWTVLEACRKRERPQEEEEYELVPLAQIKLPRDFIEKLLSNTTGSQEETKH